MRRGPGFPRRPARCRGGDHGAAHAARRSRRAPSRQRVALKALVLGAAGQLGSELVRLLGPESAVTHSAASITDAAAVEALVGARKPGVVFNCAAYNEVDRAESEPAIAFAVNSDGPYNVAVACARHGAQLIHFSTNFVFDGALDQPYVEADEPGPLSVYARSKFAGEERALRAAPGALVIRTAAVFGGSRGFPARILERVRSGQELRVVADQRVNPTFARDLAAAAVELAGREVAGLVHAVAEGCCGWDELARATVEELGLGVVVKPISARDYTSAARRPSNGCLATTRFRPLQAWREALGEWARETKKA